MQTTMKKAEVTTKQFPMVVVLSIVSGRFLDKDKGFQGIHELMDHLFPGIMTLTATAMMPVAKDYLIEQFPFLKDVKTITAENWETETAEELKKLPPQLTIEGPLQVSQRDMQKSMNEFLKKAGNPGKVNFELKEGAITFTAGKKSKK